ncbi:MAG: hypothetical protein WB630_02915, partial [Candidatus Acidiferrales bacterium]
MGIELTELVSDFASAIKEVDAEAPQAQSKTRMYQPGFGPLSEKEAVARVLKHLKVKKSEIYSDAKPARYPGEGSQCDLVLPAQWAIEVKLVRPFGDNGKQAEHWSENLLHPYPGNVSAISDCLKLDESKFQERKAVLVFVYEHAIAKVNVNVAIEAFELIARTIIGLQLGTRISNTCTELMHPHHQCATVYGWEIFTSSPKQK